MYCSKCGKQNPDEAAFCVGCGTKLNAENVNEVNAPETATVKEKAPVHDESVGEVLKKFKDNAMKTGSYIKENAVPAAKKTAEFTKEKAQNISKMSFKKLVKMLLIVAVIVTVCFFVFGKSDEGKIESLASDFAEAINDNDLDDLVDCCDPEKQESLKKTLEVWGSFGGELDLRNILGLKGNDSKVYIKVSDIEIDEEEKTATAKFEYYTKEDGELEKKSSENVNLIKVKGSWYLKDI